jgi:hypothetical protein
MASRSIYPSIPDPGNTLDTIVPSLLAVKQTLTMIILNSKKPNPNYTPSSAAQTFITTADLTPLTTKLADLEKRIAALENP